MGEISAMEAVKWLNVTVEALDEKPNQFASASKKTVGMPCELVSLDREYLGSILSVQARGSEWEFGLT